mmetsp:Transcript_31188/g.56568  ORF Transcript_31188/g.56568 Transcript_31188/m.56568 type:complete len:206 (-) Transcript_31188:146-763(-)
MIPFGSTCRTWAYVPCRRVIPRPKRFRKHHRRPPGHLRSILDPTRRRTKDLLPLPSRMHRRGSCVPKQQHLHRSSQNPSSLLCLQLRRSRAAKGFLQLHSLPAWTPRRRLLKRSSRWEKMQAKIHRGYGLLTFTDIWRSGPEKVAPRRLPSVRKMGPGGCLGTLLQKRLSQGGKQNQARKKNTWPCLSPSTRKTLVMGISGTQWK